MRWLKHIAISGSIFILLFTPGCSNQFTSIISTDQIPAHEVADMDWPEGTLLNDTTYNNYFIQRTFRVQFHIMNSRDSSRNFSKVEGTRFVQGLVARANERLQSNDRMRLPPGNTTEVLDTKIRMKFIDQHDFEQAPILFHYDDDQCYYIKKGKRSNRYSKAVLDKYGHGSKRVLNIFLMPYDPEELNSGRQKVESTGIALGNSIKLAGLFESNQPPWAFAGILNHELGHIVRLWHTWNAEDGCLDTPRNRNCWNKTSDPPCDMEVSNNVMDYNAFQSAFTPCQIERIHNLLSTPGQKQRDLLDNSWCARSELPSRKLSQDEYWKRPRDLDSSLDIPKDTRLHIATWISMPENSEIVVRKGGKLILSQATLYNDCGKSWRGIRLEKGGEILRDTDSHLVNITEY